MDDENISLTSIPVDIESSDNFLLEVALHNGKIVIVTRFDSLVDPVILSINAYRRIVQLNGDIENIISSLTNASQRAPYDETSLLKR